MNTDFLRQLGLAAHNPGTFTGTDSLQNGEKLESYSPVNGAFIGSVTQTTAEEYETVMQKAQEAFLIWREIPAPRRGEIVRQYGDLLREFKDPLGRLVSYEMGKSLQEGWGEVQEILPSGSLASSTA